MKFCYRFALILLFISTQAFAQVKLSPQSTISLLTIAPGAELYSAFGHTGVWVYDPVNRISQVYNYGTFDFVAGKEMEFYLNFIKGRLIYRLDTESFRRFDRVYHYYKRSYFSQTLSLNLEQRQQTYEFLLHNFQPENRNYLYDFIYDNCATRVMDMLDYVLKEDIVWKKRDEKVDASIRDILRKPYLEGREWSGFGIDLILGSVVDQQPTHAQQSFLPDYLAAYFDEAKILDENGNSRPLVSEKRFLYEGEPPAGPLPFFLKPIFFTFLIFLIILFFTYNQWRKGKNGLWLDRIMFGVAGMAGLILFLAWVATEHTSTAWNYNILWLFPLHIVMVGFIRKELPKWVGGYFLLSSVLIIVSLVVWMFGIQSFNMAFLPLMSVFWIRSMMLYLRTSKMTSNPNQPSK